MPTQNPRRAAERLQRVIDAWEQLRPTKLFAGMTLEQFKTKVQPSLDSRSHLDDLRTQAMDSRTQRRQADAASLQAAQLVVNGVRADAEEGEDGVLYAAMGYVPKSERRSGLTRKVTTTSAVETTTVK